MSPDTTSFGTVVSVTITLNVVVAGVPPFDAVAVTVVAPNGNGPANDGEYDTVGVGVPVTVGATTAFTFTLFYLGFSVAFTVLMVRWLFANPLVSGRRRPCESVVL